MLSQPESLVARRAFFASKHLFVTPHDDRQLYPAGDHVVQSEDCLGLKIWTKEASALCCVCVCACGWVRVVCGRVAGRVVFSNRGKAIDARRLPPLLAAPLAHRPLPPPHPTSPRLPFRTSRSPARTPWSGTPSG